MSQQWITWSLVRIKHCHGYLMPDRLLEFSWGAYKCYLIKKYAEAQLQTRVCLALCFRFYSVPIITCALMTGKVDLNWRVAHPPCE